jgi:uncharacterized membrane protein
VPNWIQPYGDAQVRSLAVQASYDGGKSWRGLELRQDGQDWTARIVRTPRRSRVSPPSTHPSVGWLRTKTKPATEGHPMKTRIRVLPVVAILGAAVMTLSATAAGSPATPPDAVRGGDSDAEPRSYLPGFVLDDGRYRTFDSPDPDIGLFPTGINNRGEITGEYLRPDGESGLFRDRRARISSFDVPGAAGTEAIRITDSGQIVGEYSNDTPFVNDSAFVRAYVKTRNGRFIRLRAPQAVQTTAAGVNERGEVVGTYVDRGTPKGPDGLYQEFHGYLWQHGRFRTIDIPRARGTELYEINNRGDMIGIYAGTRARDQHAFLLDRRGRITEIKVRGGRYTIPFGLNDHGQIVGYTSNVAPDGTATNIHGFALLKGVDGPVTRVNVPGAPQTAALGINDQGKIVGAYENPNATGLQRADGEPALRLSDLLPLMLRDVATG